jgi:hypothetical protein
MAITFNYVMDPYGIYHAEKPWDWIHNRPSLISNDYVHKAHAIQQADADVLLLGSSRVELGLDPHHAALPEQTYNLALQGSEVYENWRYLQHATSCHMPKMVIMGIDLGFFGLSHQPSTMFLEDRLRISPDGQLNPKSSFADLSRALMSFSALMASFNTMTASKRIVVSDQKGYMGDWFTDYYRIAANVLRYNAEEQANLRSSYKWEGGRNPQLDAFEKIASLCAVRHIHLIVFVNPLHADTLDRYTLNWSEYCDWLKTVTQVMDSISGLDGALWDFGSYNEMSIEPFPLSTDVYSQMRYYFESSHYRKVVGDMILDRVLTNNGPANFGVRIKTANVDQDLQRLHDEKAAWQDHGQYVVLGGLLKN